MPSSQSTALIDLRDAFTEMERELNDVGGRQRIMDRTFFERLEHKYVLLHADLVRSGLLEAAPTEEELETSSLLDSEEGGGAERGRDARVVQSISGVVAAADKRRFELLVWRATKGNAMLRFANSPRMLVQYRDGQLEEVEKDAFVIFFTGRLVGVKLRRLCDTQEARLYAVPGALREQVALLEELNRALRDHQVQRPAPPVAQSFLATVQNVCLLSNVHTLSRVASLSSVY